MDINSKYDIGRSFWEITKIGDFDPNSPPGKIEFINIKWVMMGYKRTIQSIKVFDNHIQYYLNSHDGCNYCMTESELESKIGNTLFDSEEEAHREIEKRNKNII